MDFESIKHFAHPMLYILVQGMGYIGIMYTIDLLIDINVPRKWKFRNTK